MSKRPIPIFDLSLCQGSGHCVRVCPTQCLDLWNDRPGILLPDACVACGLCEMVCTVGAVSVPKPEVGRRPKGSSRSIAKLQKENDSAP